MVHMSRNDIRVTDRHHYRHFSLQITIPAMLGISLGLKAKIYGLGLAT